MRSKAIIQRAGAQIGPVFGLTTDRAWYRAILDGDCRLFDSAAAQIADMCRAQGVTQIVADSFEFFNPMHDPCSCLAQNVSEQLPGSDTVELLTYPIERPEMLRAAAAMGSTCATLPSPCPRLTSRPRASRRYSPERRPV